MGQPKGRVVVGVDQSPAAVNLLRWADRQADLMDCDLTVVTAWRVDPGRMDEFQSTAEVLAQMRSLQARTIHEALPVDRANAIECVISNKIPSEALVELSADAELVVIGPRSANVLDGLLLGSVAENVVSRARCPVVVVHDATPATKNRIVVGVDGSDCSRHALNWAVEQAMRTASRVDAIWAWEWTPEYGVYPYGSDAASLEKTTHDRLLAEMNALEDQQRSLVDARLVVGHPARVLLKESVRADMLVVGNHRAGPLAGRLLGSVSQKVVRHAHIPVTVVHEHDHSIFDPESVEIAP